MITGKYTIQRSRSRRKPTRYDVADHHEPETRRLIKITPDDAQRTAEVFDLLLGDNLVDGKPSRSTPWILGYGGYQLAVTD